MFGSDGALLCHCREPNLGGLTKAARFFGGNLDAIASFNVVATVPPSGRQLFRAVRTTRAFTLASHVFSFFDHNDELTGELRQKWLSLNRKYVFSTTRSEGGFVFEIKTRAWTGDLDLLINGQNVARIQRKWKGTGAEFFKQRKCRYALEILEDVPQDHRYRAFLISAATVIGRLVPQFAKTGLQRYMAG